MADGEAHDAGGAGWSPGTWEKVVLQAEAREAVVVIWGWERRFRHLRNGLSGWTKGKKAAGTQKEVENRHEGTGISMGGAV